MKFTICDHNGEVVYSAVADALDKALRPMFGKEQSEEVRKFAVAMNDEWETLRLESCPMLSDDDLIPEAFKATLEKFEYTYEEEEEMTEKRELVFNPDDWNGMLHLMDEHEKFDTMLLGTNEHDECVSISIFENRIVSCTYQDNGYSLYQTYWRDGTTESRCVKE